ncbi:hypothetical protein [Cronobacter turicensis]|uniref:hypothetical protein n=1 Tax=Cronobacter turicensis TaxID=413502 RepID=UPI000CFE03EF|nr:hypothetical protein [Cronobacter turicensis]
MRKLSKGSESAVSKKIELMIKIIIRTDSYLNSANTKSTILLSLSSALIAAFAINFDKIISLVKLSSDKEVLSFLIVMALILLIASMIFSLGGIKPYIGGSTLPNSFSFVDINNYYKKFPDYQKSFSTVRGTVFLNELLALNHNLSLALVAKYKKQLKAILFLEMAAYILFFAIIIITLANI